MHRLTRVCLALAIAGLMCAGMAARAAQEALNIIPQNTEVVIGVNARQILDSDIAKKILETHPECTARMEILKNLMGIDLAKDVDTIYFFGMINDRNAGGFIFKGNYDPQKVLTLIKANPKYQTKTVDGQVYHAWYDEKEKRMKVGAMLPNGLTAVWNSEASARASAEALKDATKAYASSPDAQLIPGSDDKSSAWMVVVNRQNKGPVAKWGIGSLVASMTMGPSEVSFHSILVPQNPADAPKWGDALRGLVAFGQLQKEKPEATYLANRTQVHPSEDGKSVTATTSIETEKIMNLIERTAPKK